MGMSRWPNAPWTQQGPEERQDSEESQQPHAGRAEENPEAWRRRKADEDAGRQLLLAVRRARKGGWRHDGGGDGEDEAASRRPPLRHGEEPAPPVPPAVGWDGGEPGAGPRLVRQRNYAAVDAERGAFGLIDRGVHETGVRGLVLHRTARGRKGGAPVDVRPGTVLRVRSPATGGAGTLRVRFTTPARYYAPGQRVTTLRVGVDASDWQRFVAPRV
jgi:hypothetical protein